MNPVSLFYCFDTGGDRLCAVVAEVNNTPWSERHCYVLDLRDGGLSGTRVSRRSVMANNFTCRHFSRWKSSTVGDFHPRRAARGPIESFAGDVKAVRCDPASQAAADRLRQSQEMLARYPAMTLRNLRPHLRQAFRLWRKGAPFYPHPNSRGDFPPNDRDAETRQLGTTRREIVDMKRKLNLIDRFSRSACSRGQRLARRADPSARRERRLGNRRGRRSAESS